MSGIAKCADRVTDEKGDPAGGSCLILLYHRVTRLPFDPQLLAVTPEHFAQHMEILRRHARPTALQDLLAQLAVGKVPSRGVVVTFDDGYADNADEAAPLLERFSIPATVFVTSGYVGGEREFWWDELERLVFEPASVSSSLSLQLGGQEFFFEFEDSGAAQAAPGWNVTASATPTCRHRLYRELFDSLRPLDHDLRLRALAQLSTWAGIDPHPRPTHRPMSTAQLRRLSEIGSVEIGAHTVTHPVLAEQALAQQAREIVLCKHELETIIDRPVSSFSYPFGTRRDYTPETVRVVEDVGFVGACSNFSGAVTGGVARFELPRILVRDWDGATLLRKLTEIGVVV